MALVLVSVEEEGVVWELEAELAAVLAQVPVEVVVVVQGWAPAQEKVALELEEGVDKLV